MARHKGAPRRTTGSSRFRCLIGIMTIVAFFASLLLASPAEATDNTATDNDQVCQGLDSGKSDTTGDPKTVTLTAPTGKLIDGYCVKAGSTNNDNGPVYVTVDPPVKTLTISYPGGKDISHYSVSYTTQEKPTKPEPVVEQLLEERMSCEAGVEQRTGTKTTDWVFDEKTWTWVKTTPVVKWNSWTFVRALTDAEKAKLGCVTTTPPPPPPNCVSHPNMPGCVTPPPPPPPTPTPPYDCPSGTVWVDSDDDGVKEPGECKPKKKVRAAVKMDDKCGTIGDVLGARKSRGVVYYADGQRIREGVWLKTGGDLKVVVTAKAASKRFKLVGEDRWVLLFTNKSCGTPHVPPPTGARTVV